MQSDEEEMDEEMLTRPWEACLGLQASGGPAGLGFRFTAGDLGFRVELRGLWSRL